MSLGQNKRYKKYPLFLSQAPTHHSFSFNFRFLYELKHKVRLSKTVCRIFRFQYRFVLLKFIFLSKNIMVPSEIKMILLADSDFWVGIRSFKIPWYLRELELPKNRRGDKFFKLIKSKFWEHQCFSMVTFKYIFDIPLLINLFIPLIELQNTH